MGKSTRLPYSTVTGYRSAKRDKRTAARGMRRKQNAWLRNLRNYDENGLVPHRLECHHNEVWDWSRDGKQRLQFPSRHAYSDYCRYAQGLFRDEWERRWVERYGQDEWPPSWLAELKRK